MEMGPSGTAALLVLLCVLLALLGVLAVRTRRGTPASLREERARAVAARQALRTRFDELERAKEAEVAALKTRLEAELRAEFDARAAARGEAEARLDMAVGAPGGTSEALGPLGDGPSGPAGPQPLPRGEDAAADSTVDGADLGPLTVRAASVRGARQREDGQHRRGAVSLRVVEEVPSPTLLSVVASGAPGAPWSRSAAERACRSLTAELGRYGRQLGKELYGGEGDDAELYGVLRTAVQGVARSVRLLAWDRTGGSAPGAAKDAAVEVVLTALLTRLGDRGVREHVAFGVGEGCVSRLREGGWHTVFGGVPEGRLPAAPDALRLTRFDTRPGDVLAVSGPDMARLLRRPEPGAWFARTWAGRPRDLPAFLGEVGVPVLPAGGDRSVVCLWDFGESRRRPPVP
ncbi:hypothetical protein ACH4CD_10115 [Streptomyces fungicidicus]|uniref:hypothetical protein n=1 Tax=Streptomyces fungicidicus TaxID=68203 RepID=UPI0037BCF694